MPSKRIMWFGAFAVGVVLLVVAGFLGISWDETRAVPTERSRSEDDSAGMVKKRVPARKLIESSFAFSDYPSDDQEEIFPRVIAFSRHNTNAEDIVRQFFSEEDVPVLLSMLLEPVYRSAWQDLIWIIPHLSTSETRDAIVSTFVEFSSRDGSWERWESAVFEAKLYSIRLLGYLGGEEADSVLRSVITVDGAREFSEAWRERPLPGVWGRSLDVMGRMQSEAAMGLIFTRKPENIQLVEELHQQLYDEAQSVFAITGREYTRNEYNTVVLFELVAETLAMRDMMQELGYDEFKPLFFDTLARWSRIGPYLTKYGVPESP